MPLIGALTIARPVLENTPPLLQSYDPMLKRVVSHPGFALFWLIIGGPGNLDSVGEWVDLLGMNALVTLALVSAGVHITAVWFRDWEPYRSWLRRSRLYSWLKVRQKTVAIVCLTADTEGKTIQEKRVRVWLTKSSLIEFRPTTGRPKYCVQVPRGYVLDFDHHDTHYVPRSFVAWPEGGHVRYVIGDQDVPELARCMVTMHWVGA